MTVAVASDATPPQPAARWSAARLLLALAAGAGIWAVAALICLAVGSTGVGIPARWQVEERLSPLLLASLVGAALGAAGTVYQAVLRNPLAEPYLLGVSTGASLATYLWALPFATAPVAFASISQQAFAFAGAAAAVSITFALAQSRGRLEPVTLLLVGVIVNAVNWALFLLLYHLNLRRDITESTGGPFRFLVGAIQTNVTDAQVMTAGVCIAAGWVGLLWAAGSLNVATLGESEAQALGVRIHRLRWTAICVASLITAAAVSLSGPIGFVGLICPHVARLIVGRDQRRLLPASTALGAALLALADAASRLLSGRYGIGTMLPVGVLTGLLGGPFFLLLLWQTRRKPE